MNTQIIIDRIKDDFVLNNLASFFDNKMYLVGGAVRDYLLDKETFDRDLIVVDIEAREFSLMVSEFFNGTFIPLDEDNKIYRVVLPDKVNFIDITNPVCNSLEKDIMRRDLTINAVAVDIKSGEIVDYAGGLVDFDNKVLKGVQEVNFEDDPLRLLRIFRFHSLLGFEVSQELMDISKKYANLINQPAKERIQYELMKLFSGRYADNALLLMDEAGLLDLLFSFVVELKQIPPNLHHHLDLFHHSIETVHQVQKFYDCAVDDVKIHMDKVDFGGFSRLAHLKLAAFMHDIGKFSTWTIEPGTGRHRFIKHEDVGSKMVPDILRNMCFSNKQIEYVKYIVKKHMYPTAVVSAPDLSEKVMMRYVRKSEDNAIDTILIAQADRLSAQGPEITHEIVEENIAALNKLLYFYLDALKTLEPLPKLLDGKDIMRILNIKPSKKLGEIISALEEAQINGEVVTKDDAVLFIKNYHIV